MLCWELKYSIVLQKVGFTAGKHKDRESVHAASLNPGYPALITNLYDYDYIQYTA